MKNVGSLIGLALLVWCSSCPVSAAPIAHWSFDEGAGSIAHDPYGHDGAIYGATWVDGVFGKALSFNGLSDYGLVGDSDAFDPTSTQEMTISAWLNISTYQAKTSSVTFAIVGKTDASGRENGNYFFSIRNSNNPGAYVGRLDFGVVYDGLHWQDVYSNSLVPKDRWVQVAVTHDSSGNTKSYVDGILDAVDSSTITAPFANTDETLTIGYANGYWDYFNGSIDDVRMYDRALSASEIQGLLPNTIPAPGAILLGTIGAGLVGWLRRRRTL